LTEILVYTGFSECTHKVSLENLAKREISGHTKRYKIDKMLPQKHTAPCRAAEGRELILAERCGSMQWFRQQTSHNVSSGSSQSAFLSDRDQLCSDTNAFHVGDTIRYK